jgi:hypothetical protein
VTHRGPRSPYTYVPLAAGERARPVTRNAAPDAITILPVTRFFYDGTTPDYRTAHNLRLPLHSFLVATVASFVRPYLLANDLTNLLILVLLAAAALRLAARYEIDMRAALLALATVCALPPVVGYVGQAMHYIVGPGISFLIVLAVLALDDNDLRNPWTAGLLTAILMIHYDWYVYVAAIAVYVLFVVRFTSRRDALVYAIVALAPPIAWNAFLKFISGGSISNKLHNLFMADVLSGWLEYLVHPSLKPLLPVAVTQIGAQVAFHQIIAIIYWPLVACCAVALWRMPAGTNAFRGRALLLLLVGFYLLEQLFTAAFDWENNPRRALPVFIVFAFAYCWAIDRHLRRKGWAIAFVALFALTSFVAFADTILGTPAAPSLYMGDTIRSEIKMPLRFQNGRIVLSETLEPEYVPLQQPFPRARLENTTAAFAAANAFAGAAVIALFWIVARAGLLPRLTPHIAAAVWLASAIRFVV